MREVLNSKIKYPKIYLLLFPLICIVLIIITFLWGNQSALLSNPLVTAAILILISTGVLFLILQEKQFERRDQAKTRREESRKPLQGNFEKLLRNANDVIFISDEKGDLTFINQKVIDVYGYSEEEILELNVKDIRADSRPFDMAEFKKMEQRTGGFIFQTRHKKKDGSSFPVEISAQLIEIDGKTLMQGFVRDISSRIEAEKKITQFNRIYSVLSNVNQMIVRVKDKSTLFREACEIAVGDGKFRTAWIALQDPATGKLNIVSQAGYSGKYIKKLKTAFDNPEKLSGAARYSLENCTYQIYNYSDDESPAGEIKAAALKDGYSSMATFPLISASKAIGIIGLYSEQDNFFTEDEVKLFEEMASDISYAIEFLDNEIKRTEAEKALQESFERYKDLFENNPIPMWIYDEDSLKIIDTNKISTLQYGYTKDEFLSMDLTGLHAEEEIPFLREIVSQRDKVIRHTDKIRHKRKDGSFFYAEVKSTRLPFDGEKNYRIVLINDITEKLKADEALRESEERMKVIIEGTPHLFFYVQDAEGKISYISPSVETMTGHKPEEWMERKDWFITDSELNRKAVESTHAHLRGDFSENKTLVEIKHADGSLIYLEAYEYPIISNGNITGLQGVAHNITEKIVMEKALKESEERWHFALEGSNNGVFDWNITTNEIFFSRRWKEMLGYKDHEFKNNFSEWEKRIHPEDKENIYRELNKHLSGETPFYISEHRMLHKEGGYRWILAHGKVVSWAADGKPERMVGTHTDISARKKFEEDLRISEEKYRSLFENTMVGVYRTTPDGRILLANPALLKMLGYTSFDELAPRNLEEKGYEPQYNRSAFRDTIEMNGKVTGYESVWTKSDGSRIHIRENARAIKDKDGETLYYEGIVEDITEKKKAEEELVKLTSAVTQSPINILITDKDGYIEYCNPRLTEVTGYTIEDLKGKTPRVFKSGTKSDEEYKILWKTILSGQQWSGELFNKKKDGTFYWASASISPVKDKDGIITHFVAIEEDITEKKRNLEELIIAKDKAEAANKARDLFLANMSHELRTPLIGILGYSEMLADQLTGEDNIEMAKGIMRGGNRLLKTLNLLLDITRIKSDKMELHIENKNIAEELELVFNMFKGIAREKKLEYSMQLLSENLTARVDSNMLMIILENLVNNAVKFTLKGRILLSADRAGDKIIIKVSDTGIGIDKKNFEQIFEEFRQISEGINREFQGTGLGLAISKKYAEILKGTIEVESKLGEGTAFTLSLPAV